MQIQRKTPFQIIITSVLLTLHFMMSVNCVKFNLEILGLQRQCFYEVLGKTQKYSLELSPLNQPKYEIQISQDSMGTWKNVFYKMTTSGYQRVQVHKLSGSSATYSFCIKNIQRQALAISIKFKTGLHLMQFQILPDKSDTQNLNRQVNWIEAQKQSLYETISKIQVHKANNQESSILLSKKMILFALLGLSSVLIVNYLLFKEVKKTFKQRKLI